MKSRADVNDTTGNPSQSHEDTTPSAPNATLGLFTHMEADEDNDSGWDKALLISDQQFAVVRSLLAIVGYVFLALAVVLTVLNILVFLNPRMRSPTGKYVVGISAAQLLNSLTVAVYIVMTRMEPDFLNSYAFWLYSVQIASYVAAVTRRGSYVLMVCVSTERLVAVVWPLHVRQFFLRQHPVIVIATAYLSACLAHVYIVVKYRVVPVSRTGGATGYGVERTALFLRDAEIWDFINLLAKALFMFLPILVLLILTVLTIMGLRRHNVMTSKMTSSSSSSAAATTTFAARAATVADDVKRRRERQMTVTIFTATCCYVILSLPAAFHYLFSMLFPNSYAVGKRYSNLNRVVGMVGGNLSDLSSAVDFVCFTMTSSTYRRVLLHVLGVRGHGKGKGKAGHTSAGSQSEVTKSEEHAL